MNKNPKLYDKNYYKLFEEFKSFASQFTPEWHFDENSNDFGVTLAKIFCDMQENTINKLNKSINNIYLEFLNIIGVSPMTRKPAQGFATIEASKNAITSCIKKGAKISSGKDLVFETDEDVFVIDTSIQTIFMTDFANKKIIKVFDGSVEDPVFTKFQLFNFDNFENLQFKALYISDNKMFDTEKLNLIFKFENKIIKKQENKILDFFLKSKWQIYDAKNKKWEDASKIEAIENNFINVKFDKKAGDFKLLDQKSKYLRVIPAESEEINLTDISYFAKFDNFNPTEFFAGDEEIEEKEFFPFRERYYIYDTFYIKCNELLNKPGANITLSTDINFLKIKTETKGIVKNYKMIMSDMDFAESEPSDINIESVVWEYFKGNAWASLKTENGSKFFSAKNQSKKRSMEFVCPDNLAETEVNSKNGFFIRAKIMKINNQFSNYANYIVPILKNVSISCNYNEPLKLNKIIVNKNLEWDNIIMPEEDNQVVNVFENDEKTPPAVYINISKPISFGILSVFFDIEEGIFKDKISYKWQFWGKAENNILKWQDLDIIDFTDNLSKSGLVKVFGTKNFEKLRLFGKTGYFIRILSISRTDKKINFPVIRDIKFNTIKIIQKESKPYEYFSVNGKEKNKICSLSSKDIFDVNVWVDELREISKDEQEKIKKFSPENIEIKSNKSDIEEKVWVKWQEVSNILSCGPKDRVYEVNTEKSQIIFGDGKHGKIPTEQFGESIRISYSITKGEKGNVDKNSIGEFESVFPSVISVYNSSPLFSGLDSEDIDHAAKRTFSEISRGGRIISTAGFEKAILFQNRNVFKVKCFPHIDKYGRENFGYLTVVVLPKVILNSYDKFLPIKKDIENFINNNAPFNFVNSKNLSIREVQYVEFYVNIAVTIKNLNDYQDVHSKINSRLKNFLNPISGGQTGIGFEIGKIPNERDIINTLNFIPGLNRIEKVNISTKIITEKGKQEILLSDAQKCIFAVPIPKDIDIEIHI